MKILVMTDMEGSCGIINHDDWVLPSGKNYDEGRELVTMETNAAIEGFFVGGAKEVGVVDGHGVGGLNAGMLDERVKVWRATEAGGWPFGLDASYDGVGWVGQHAKSGTPYSHITHTQGFEYLDVSVNGVSIGEYGQLALCAMELGVPSILACGEEAFTTEAEALTPGVITAVGKRGLLADGLDDLDAELYAVAKLEAEHLKPEEARALIRSAAEEAVRKLGQEGQAGFAYPEMKAPYEMVVKFRARGGRPAETVRVCRQDSIVELMRVPLQ